MTHVPRAPDARPSSEGRASEGRFRKLAAHPWAKLGARALVLLVGLFVLVLIGSNAKAVPNAASATPTANATSTPTSTGTAAPTSTSTSALTSTSSSSSTPPSPLLDHAARATPDDPVHLNSAAEADLERLPSIGPKRAASILSLRAKLGRFREVEDLMRVKGIGRSTIKKLRPLVRLD